MDYEKKYKKALEWAKQVMNGETGFIRKEVEEVFPELKESEDERIRREIIEYIKTGTHHKDWITWLEKQGESDETKAKMFLINKGYPIDANGKFPTYEEMYDIIKDGLENQSEQKTFDYENANIQQKDFAPKVEPKFKVGDWIVNRFGNVWYIYSYDNKNYKVSNEKGDYNYLPIEKQDEMHPWTINDAKDGDAIVYKDEISLYKHDIKNCTKEEITFGGFVYHCCYDGKGFIIDSLYSLTEKDKKDIHPATKEHRVLLFKKIKESKYQWDVEKKKLKKIEKKPAWNNEDETVFFNDFRQSDKDENV